MIARVARKTVLTCAFVCSAGLAVAHAGATGVVKERMDAMKEMGEVTKYLALWSRGILPHDPERLRATAQILSSRMENSLERFPEGSLHSPTEALPTIWEDWPAFEEEARQLIALATALSARANAPAEAMALVPQIGESCTSCHQRFKAD
jgi:cytochrome c556